MTIDRHGKRCPPGTVKRSRANDRLANQSNANDPLPKPSGANEGLKPASKSSGEGLPKPRRRSRAPRLKRRRDVYYPTGVTPEAFLAAFEGQPPAVEPSANLQKVESAADQTANLQVENFADCEHSKTGKFAGLADLASIDAMSDLPAIEGRSLDMPAALLMLARLRDEAAAEIERLLAFLDASEMPDDFELDGDELDGGDDDDEDGADDEPSLAAPEQHPRRTLTWHDDPIRDDSGDQHDWTAGADDDCEGDEHDGAEPDVDDEPSLGAADHIIDQREAWRVPGTGGDLEHDPAESGIADFGGLQEQAGFLRFDTR